MSGNTRKNKSRTHLYNAIEGAVSLTGASGVSSRWTIAFPNLAAVGDTVTIGEVVFQYVAEGSESVAGATAGTVADPHLISIGTATPDATKAATNLVTSMLAETTTTGAWGVLYPDDSVGASNIAGTVTINFWPGTAQNATTYITVTATGTDPTVTNTVTGVGSRGISTSIKTSIIDTTGSAQNKEIYTLEDGSSVGQGAKVLIKAADGSDTPCIIGNLEDTEGTAYVEALFTTGDTGQTAEFIWMGSRWKLIAEGAGTALTWLASA